MTILLNHRPSAHHGAPHRIQLREHLGHDWHRFPVSFMLPESLGLKPGDIVSIREAVSRELIPAQIGPDGKLWFIANLPPGATLEFEVLPGVQSPATRVNISREAGSFVLDSGAVAIGVPDIDSNQAVAPVQWISGPERIRRGQGRWASTLPLKRVHSFITSAGPVFVEVAVAYHFVDGSSYQIAWRLYDGAPVALASEIKTVRDGGQWSFSLYENFAPNSAHMRYGSSGTWPIDYAREDHICRHIYSNHWDLYQDFKEVSFLYRKESGDAGDAIGVFPVDGDGWEQVVQNIISLDVHAQPSDVDYSFSLSPGRRMFALFAIPFSQTREAADQLPSDGWGAYKLKNRWSMVTLDGVKEMCLDWDEPVPTEARLTVSAGRLEEVRLKVKQEPQVYGDVGVRSMLFNDSPEILGASKAEFLKTLHRLRFEAIVRGPNPSSCNPVMFRPLIYLPWQFEMLQVLGVFTPEEIRSTRAILAFLAYFTDREDYNFCRKSLLPSGHPDDIMSLYHGMRSENMGLDRWIGIGMVGMLFANHPQAPAWRAMAMEQFEISMKVLVAECGAWCEGWGYFRWSLHLLADYVFAAKNSGTDLYSHEQYKKMFRFMIQMIGPRNAAYEGKRITPAYGSYGESENFSGCGFSYLVAKAAYAYRDTDPLFSRELMWAYREMGEGPFQKNVGLQSHDFEQIALQTDFDLAASEPMRSSQGMPGFGAVFHHADDEAESYLAIRAAPAWPHGHPDPGSFFFNYRGTPFITEAARGTMKGYPFIKHLAQGHNIIRFDGKDPFHYVWPCRQNLVKFEQRSAPGIASGIEYAVLDCFQERVILSAERRRGHGDAITKTINARHYRHIICLWPDLIIIFDAIRSEFESDYRLHCQATSAEIAGSQVHFTGAFGYDLGAKIVEPATPKITLLPVLDTIGMEFAQAPNQPYMVVLNPRPRGDRSAIATQWDGRKLSIATGSRSVVLRFEESTRAGVYDIRVED